jgi:hypothetical protein
MYWLSNLTCLPFYGWGWKTTIVCCYVGIYNHHYEHTYNTSKHQNVIHLQQYVNPSLENTMQITQVESKKNLQHKYI